MNINPHVTIKFLLGIRLTTHSYIEKVKIRSNEDKAQPPHYIIC